MRRALLLVAVCFISLFAHAQKALPAVRTDAKITVDGDLKEPAWKQAPLATNFIEWRPAPGVQEAEATKTEVWLLYDDEAIYIAGFCHEPKDSITKELVGRDVVGVNDFVGVIFDTYLDKINGFGYYVTPLGEQFDCKYSTQGEDGSWSSVWHSNSKIYDNGWSFEMKIPYSAIRFSNKNVQTRGLNITRRRNKTGQQFMWNKLDPTINGFLNQFGQWQNLENIKPPVRLSFSPYLATYLNHFPHNTPGKKNWSTSINGGMDVKYGISNAFTLDMTLIPDFGQVISDNVVNNLTPYEVRFQENRPFFTEGTELFNKAGLFYSRRVGSIPSGYYTVLGTYGMDPNKEILKNPSQVQLYNAIKFSGRTRKKLGIGVFNAVTAPMHARVRDRNTGEVEKIQTEPLANYNILGLDQAFEGRSYLTFTNTNVIRNGSARDANVSALDLAFYNRANTHALAGTVRYSRIWDEEEYDGFNSSLRFGKVSGNWQYALEANVESEFYDPNDLGFLAAPNEIVYQGSVNYRQFTPTEKFITYNYSLQSRLQYTIAPYAYNKVDLIASGFWVFKNFWDISLTSYLTPGWERNYFALFTPGQELRYPTNFLFDMNGSTDSRKKWFVRFGAVYARAPEYDNTFTSVSLGSRYRFSNKFSLDLQTDSHYETNQLGFAFEREMNGDPIAGFRNNRDFTTVLSGIYNFHSRLNLTLRARHYWNRVNYVSFHGVDENGYLLPHSFISGKNENVNLFNLDAFLTWDFRLGSRLILGYKNWLGDEELITIPGRNTYLKNLGRVFDARHGNEFTARFIYFLDYNQFK